MIFIPGNVPSSKNNRLNLIRPNKLCYSASKHEILENPSKFFFSTSVMSNRCKKYIKESGDYYLVYKNKFKNERVGLKSPLYVDFTFYRKSRHRWDETNAVHLICDLMVKYGWIEDDNVDFLRVNFGDHKYCKENPGVEIRLISNFSKTYIGGESTSKMFKCL